MALNTLIVDDSAVMRGAIRRTLDLCGIPLGQVNEAANGREALAILDERSVDLALVDTDMPVMGGREFIAAARGRTDSADLLFIVVSAEGSETRIGELRAQGAEFVRKPFSPEDLRRTIVRLTGVIDEN